MPSAPPPKMGSFTELLPSSRWDVLTSLKQLTLPDRSSVPWVCKPCNSVPHLLNLCRTHSTDSLGGSKGHIHTYRSQKETKTRQPLTTWASSCRYFLAPGTSHLRVFSVIPSGSVPPRLHTCNFAIVVQLSSQCHFRLLFRSQPLTLFALLFNQSPVCISRLGCHREGYTTLAGWAHCLCPSPAPSCQVPPKNFHHAPAVASANSSFCTLHNCLWISLSAIPSLSFSSVLFSLPIGNFPL